MDKKISIVYITKNECSNLKKSIESCKEIADEIIVVDTGSTDNTKEMLKQYSNINIKDFEWVDDFSKARNYALDQCQYDYIIFLDTDERFERALTKTDKKSFVELFENGEIDILTFMEQDIEETTGIEHYTTFSPRAFRNDKNIRYAKPIHETLVHLQGKPFNSKAVASPFNLLHTGYSKNVVKSKVKRNIDILEKLENPTTMDYFYLCREYLSLHQYEKSWDYCVKFFNQQDHLQYIKNTDIAYSIYFLKMVLMFNLDKKYELIDIIKELENAKNVLSFFPQYYFELGKLYYNLDFLKAEKYFKEALITQKSFTESGYTYLNNFESFKSELYAFLAKIEFLKGNIQNAINKAGVACVFAPKNIDNLILLSSFLSHKRDQQTIEKNLNFIYQLYMPNTKDDFIFLSKGLGNTNLTEEFVYNTITVLKNFQLTPEDTFNESYYAELFATNSALGVLQKLENVNNEAGNIIKLCCLIYQNALDESNKITTDAFMLLAKLDKKYAEVYNILTQLRVPSVITDQTKELLYETIIKLIHLGFVDFNKDFLNVLFKCYNYTNAFSNILKVWLSDYNKNEVLKAVEFLSSLSEDEIEDKQKYYNDYFYLLYLLEEYDLIVTKSNEIPKQYLSYNFLRMAKPSKGYVKIQRQLCSGR